jgi:DNA processing protein
VVEATRKSGSLITARLAAEQNREVFAVPGSIQSFKSTGTHTLIKQGAKLVENAQDVIEELAPGVISAEMKSNEPGEVKPDKKPPLSPQESTVYAELGPYPVHIDELVRNIGMAPGKLSSILLKLELMGIIQQSPGKRFSTKG